MASRKRRKSMNPSGHTTIRFRRHNRNVMVQTVENPIPTVAKVPSLISLVMESVKVQLLAGNDLLPDIYELPSDLFDSLVNYLPPLVLQKLQAQMPFEIWNDYESIDDCLKNGKNRGRNGNFNRAWKALFELRWPELVDRLQPVEWQQMYWETHLQKCLDEAAAVALLPSFGGCISEIRIPDTILKYIGYEEHINHSAFDYSKLAYHCQQFGCHARCLKLKGVLCMAETYELLKSCKLESLIIRWIVSKEQVDEFCKLLIKNSETLTSLELFHCEISASFINAICDSLYLKSTQTHGLQHLSISSSIFVESNPVSLPHGLTSFLSSGRSLYSLKFCNSRLDRNYARMVFSTLLDCSSSLSILDLSENDLTGWLTNFSLKTSSDALPSLRIGKSLQSLRVLNLRGSSLRKDDIERLRYALVYLPNLEILDLSDNSIEDDGIRSLIPYLVEASERCAPLANLNLESCELSCRGVTQLLSTISAFKSPLRSLSIADNGLGSQVAAALGKFLHTPVQVLNIGAIGLGPSGFQKLHDIIKENLKLLDINISKNRGGIETAKFLSKLMLCAPELVTVNAAYNLMPAESLPIICSALEVAKGHLESLNLTGNKWDNQTEHASMLAEFQHCGRPIVILPSSGPSSIFYDHDP